MLFNNILCFEGEIMMNESILNQNKNALLLLSGGRDSFLSACHLIEEGYYVYMVTYDNGHMQMPDNVRYLAERIIERFGKNHVEFLGISLIADIFYPLWILNFNTDYDEITEKYPKLHQSQLNCLTCHTAMYVQSIAICKTKKINCIAEGMRKQQGFFVELPEMKKRYEELCKEYELDLLTPVYDLNSDMERKMSLLKRGFTPKSYEPQCLIGCPLNGSLNDEQITSLANYYDNEIYPKLSKLIDDAKEYISKEVICEQSRKYIF